MSEQGCLTTHILDTAGGRPAAGVTIDLYRVNGDSREHMKTATTNSDGRTDAALITEGALQCGSYELVFQVGDYFAASGPKSAHPFIDIIPIRFGIDDHTSHYHVPLLVSPYSYSTYRGS